MDTKRQNELREALERIRLANGGRLTRELVVQEAKADRTGVLGREFQWNLRKAAEQRWLDVAQTLIARYVTITVIHRSRQVIAPMYVRDPRCASNEQGHIALSAADMELQTAQGVIINEVSRCEASINRGRAIAMVLDAKFPGLMFEFEQMLERLVEIRAKLAA